MSKKAFGMMLFLVGFAMLPILLVLAFIAPIEIFSVCFSIVGMLISIGSYVGDLHE